MKKAFQIIFTLGLFLMTQFLFAQTKIQNLQIETYIVTSSDKAYKSDGNKPTFQATIQLDGIPAPGHTIRQMILNFYLDDRGTTFKPIYDEKTMIAQGFYPMSEFDKTYQLLKHKRNQLSAMFIDSSTGTTEILLTVSGKMPMKI